jgi:hypothetical protein
VHVAGICKAVSRHIIGVALSCGGQVVGEPIGSKPGVKTNLVYPSQPPGNDIRFLGAGWK